MQEQHSLEAHRAPRALSWDERMRFEAADYWIHVRQQRIVAFACEEEGVAEADWEWENPENWESSEAVEPSGESLDDAVERESGLKKGARYSFYGLLGLASAVSVAQTCETWQNRGNARVTQTAFPSPAQSSVSFIFNDNNDRTVLNIDLRASGRRLVATFRGQYISPDGPANDGQIPRQLGPEAVEVDTEHERIVFEATDAPQLEQVGNDEIDVVQHWVSKPLNASTRRAGAQRAIFLLGAKDWATPQTDALAIYDAASFALRASNSGFAFALKPKDIATPVTREMGLSFGQEMGQNSP